MPFTVRALCFIGSAFHASTRWHVSDLLQMSLPRALSRTVLPAAASLEQKPPLRNTRQLTNSLFPRPSAE